jgi:DNA repair photolyase
VPAKDSVRPPCEHVFVRWENLTVGSEEGRRLPGYRDPAVVRTFDAPEALDTRFYEVRARSALNRVPEKSRMPFRWTINPYRGCSHACSYCMAGETQILMADGRTKDLADLRIGDAIYGTARIGRYRRYVVTEVLAHWETLRKGHRVRLDDGTELITSGDHRFLSDRGWKFVTGAEQGRARRPHLTPNNRLLGPGPFAAPPRETLEYQRGYICGMVRGDGHVGSYSYSRPGRRSGDVHRFRLALTDLEPLLRTRHYLTSADVETTEFAYLAAGPTNRAMSAIRTSSRRNVSAVREMIEWPERPDSDWVKGFLAGVFDAEGGCSRGILRISNTDPAIVGQITLSLRRLGFTYAVEDPGLPNGLRSVRITGGLPEQLRFFQTVDPATTRKRSIEGRAVKNSPPRRVVSVDALRATVPLFDITTGTGDFIANGVVSHNCFARPTHEYLGMDAGRDFEREIVVKVNVPEVLRAELKRPSWKREHVALGTNTDPYQWVEGRYKLMRGIWEAMRDFANPCSILTKSPLLLRDVDLLKEVAERTEVSACLSVPTLDEKAWRSTEPHTPHPRKRLEAIAELNRAGIPTGVLIAPLMPGINDAPEQVERILELASEAGAVSAGGTGLHLRGSVRDVFFDWLRAHRPDLLPRYEGMYAHGAYLRGGDRKRIEKILGDARAKAWRPSPRRSGGLRWRGERRADPAPGAEPEQGALF